MNTSRPNTTHEWKSSSLGEFRPLTAKNISLIHSNLRYQALAKLPRKKSCSSYASAQISNQVSFSPQTTQLSLYKSHSSKDVYIKKASIFANPSLDPVKSLYIKSIKIQVPINPNMSKRIFNIKYNLGEGLKKQTRSSKNLKDLLKKKEEYKLKTSSIQFEEPDFPKEYKVERIKKIYKSQEVIRPMETIYENKEQELNVKKSPLTIQRLNKFLYNK